MLISPDFLLHLAAQSSSSRRINFFIFVGEVLHLCAESSSSSGGEKLIAIAVSSFYFTVPGK